MAIISSSAALRITSNTMSPAAIANLLKIKGARLVESNIGPQVGKKSDASQTSESRWILESPCSDSSSVSEHIEYILALVEQHLNEFREISNQSEIDIWCTVTIGHGQGGMDLDPQLIKRLAAVPVRLIFGLYSE